MLRHFLIKLLFLMVSLLLISCASQKLSTLFNTADINPELNSVQPTQDVKTVKEISLAIEQTSTSKADSAPGNIPTTFDVQFDSGKANIKPKYYNDIKRIADFMSKYPSTSVVIEGHTDNIGNELVNVKLSHQRAYNIKAYIVQKFRIDSSRIRVIGYDYQKPIASNETPEGKQKNRRGETHIETNMSLNNSYSFFEDSDLPKGGFSIVNQESIDAKIKSFKEKHGVAYYANKTVKAPTLELYKMWRGVFSHCAIRIETDPHSFYQMELQTLPDLKKVGIRDFHKIGAVINLLGVTKDQFDIVEFTDKNERKKLDNSEPPYATMPICTDIKTAKKSTQWYRDCLSRYARSYNPENALKTGKRTKAFEYNPPTHNCCNFAEEALKACGLAHCFDLGKSSGLDSKAGLLEE